MSWVGDLVWRVPDGRAVELNAAAKQASEPTERLAVANAGWARWILVNAAGIAAFIGGGLAVMWGNKGRTVAQEGVARASMAKNTLSLVALAPPDTPVCSVSGSWSTRRFRG